MNLGSAIRNGGISFEESADTNPIAAVPTLTTKALLLSIAVPRIYRVYIPPKENAVAINDSHRAFEQSQGSQTCHSVSSDGIVTNKADTATSATTTTTSTTGELSTDSLNITSSNRLSQARKEVPLTPDDYDDELGTDSKKNATMSVISRVATMLMGESVEGEADDENGRNAADIDQVSDVRIFHVDSHDNLTESIQEHELGYVEGDESHGRRNGSIVEHVVTREEMNAIVRIAMSDDVEDNAQPVNQEEPQHNPEEAHQTDQTDPSMITAASSVIKSFFGVINTNSENSSAAYLSREEAVAAIKRYEPLRLSQKAILELDDETNDDDDDKVNPKPNKPNTEIKVEDLTRLTLRRLYAENHFYNAPIYSGVQTRVLEKANMDDWVEVSVMAKPASIGIILERLERIGVGSSIGTIAIYKAELLRTCDILNENANKEEPTLNPKNGEESHRSGDVDADAAASQKAARMEAARVEWKNAASRLRIEQVKEEIQEQAEMTFDYLSLLVIASILAGIGLVTDNAVVIVASMLVSPLMGPVMGMTFGTQVSDWGLAARSSWNELVSLLISVLTGIVIGLAVAFCPAGDNFPVEQMYSRGDVNGLYAGLAIALASGAGVALSILGNNTASLVGVAISASLLPPAVNAGICWIYAILIRVGSVEAPFNEADGEFWNFNQMAGISFALTMLNIVSIWLSGLLMFRIKEVAPTKSKTAFWSSDIKVAKVFKQGPEDINLDDIKAGLQDVISKEREGKGIHEKLLFEEASKKGSPSTKVNALKRLKSVDFDV